MTARERVAAAMRRGVPDCVPVIPQICHPHAIRCLGLDFETSVLDCIGHPERVNELQFECALRYGVDGVRVWPLADAMDVEQIAGVWHGRDRLTGEIRGTVDFKGGGWVIGNEEILLANDEDIAAIPVPTAAEIIAGESLDSARAILERAGDNLFVISTPGCFTVQYLTFQRGKARALMDLLDSPDFCHQALEKALAVSIQEALALAKIGIHGLMLGDTFGGVVGPKLFAEFCVPYFRRFVETLHGELGNDCPLIYLHICGKTTPILGLMADTGVDCIEPLDVLDGVQVRDAKERVGDRVALMGGVNTVELARGTLEAVQKDIERCLREGAPGGGYLLACCDMLPTETAPEKVAAMVEAAHDFAYGQEESRPQPAGDQPGRRES